MYNPALRALMVSWRASLGDPADGIFSTIQAADSYLVLYVQVQAVGCHIAKGRSCMSQQLLRARSVCVSILL